MKGTSDFLVFKQTGLFGRFFYLCNRIVTASGYGRGFLAYKNAPQAVACGASGKVTFHGLKWAAQAELCAPWVGFVTFRQQSGYPIGAQRGGFVPLRKIGCGIRTRSLRCKVAHLVLITVLSIFLHRRKIVAPQLLQVHNKTSPPGRVEQSFEMRLTCYFISPSTIWFQTCLCS